MKNITVDQMLEVIVTPSLNDADRLSFEEYCRAEIGTLIAFNKDQFKGVVIKGKSDKAKGKIKGGDIDFAGHNIALATMDLATRVLTVCASTGYELPKIDVDCWALGWKERRDTRAMIREMAKVPTA